MSYKKKIWICFFLGVIFALLDFAYYYTNGGDSIIGVLLCLGFASLFSFFFWIGFLAKYSECKHRKCTEEQMQEEISLSYREERESDGYIPPPVIPPIFFD